MTLRKFIVILLKYTVYRIYRSLKMTSKRWIGILRVNIRRIMKGGRNL